MGKENILIVEDDKDIQTLIDFNLTREGYKTTKVSSGDAAVKIAMLKSFDLCLLDILLPDIDGFQVCRILREDYRTQNLPIIMLTAKSEDSDIITGLELGADDYITKPFSPKILISRIRVALRRKKQAAVKSDSPITVGDITINPGRREVLIGGRRIDLTFTEFQLLYYLAGKPGWVFTRYQLVNAIRGEDYPVTDRSIDVQIAGLRKKMGSRGDCVETIRGVGYRLSDITC
jgi:two-component system, OmpR family, alkaline phosphatase synthesis response regulator PhoP